MNSGKNILDKSAIQSDRKSTPQRNEVWRMFDRIAARYDLLNRLLSFSQDIIWRNKIAGHLGNNSGLYVLDAATGTGDVLISLFKKSNKIKAAVGIDLAKKMLQIGQRKVEKRGLSKAITLVHGDAATIPVRENILDAVTIAFGIRNVTHVDAVLSEIYRTLKKEGKVIILEFSIPKNNVIKTIYLLYFRHILPFLGSLISGDSCAYRYLNQTVETFPYGDEFCGILRRTGFKNVYERSLTFGIASIYCGEKST